MSTRTLIWLVAAALLSAGCAATPTEASREWSAAVSVRANRATITVDVPGWAMGTDYHVHFSLDGGPEVMAYAPVYTFANLRPGAHRVVVTIADPDHKPIPGMSRTFEVTVAD